MADQLWLMTRIREEEEVSASRHFLLQAPQCPCSHAKMVDEHWHLVSAQQPVQQ